MDTSEYGPKVIETLSLEHINRLLFWFESEPVYADFCQMLRAEIARREASLDD